MPRLRAIVLAASALLPVLAHAAVEPRIMGKDSRIRSLPYDPSQSINLASTGLSPIRLVLDRGEAVTSLAGAMVFRDPKLAKEAGGWFAVTSQNVLILQPLKEQERSTMVFVQTTAANGEPRRYAAVLSTRPGDIADPADKAAYAEVSFTTYPRVPTPEEAAAWRAKRDAAVAAQQDRLTQARLAQAQYSVPRNYAYLRGGEGCPVVAPLRVSDDGHQTTLLFAPHQTKPEIYALTPGGKPTLLNTVHETTAAGLLVTLPAVYREMRLLRDDKLCGLRNRAYDPVGTQPGGGTGTIARDVVRQVRSP